MTDLRRKITQDPFLINTLLLSLLVMALALQLLIGVVWVYSFIPIKLPPIFSTLFYRHQALVFPKRDMMFYHLFILTAVFLQVGGMFILRKHLSKNNFLRKLLMFVAAEYGWTFLIVFAVFKMFVYDFASWAKGLFYLSLGLSIVSKIFWNEIGHFYIRVLQYWENHKVNIKTQRLWDLFFAVLIFLIIYIPDNQGLLAKMFMTDHFDHFDTMIMSPAWAFLKGSVLDIDQFTHYAVGLPVVIGRLAQLMGGFSYSSVMMLLGIGMVFYYIGTYALARFWLKSIPVAMAMVILLIKWQMFHPGVAIIIFNYPSATIWRYPLDIFFLFLLLSHLRHPNWRLLVSAGAVCGFSCFYMMDTGGYMFLAFIFFLLCEFIMEAQTASLTQIRSKAMKVAGLLLTVPVTALGWLWLTQGQYLFTGVFWHNLAERVSFLLMGYDELPMYKSLLAGKYLESWMGFFIPWFYVFVLIVTLTLYFLKKVSREYLFIATLSIYGLGLYHYYICRSADTSYYVIVLPFVFILGFILNRIVGREHSWRKQILGSVLAAALFSLLTNHYFLDYPNLLNLSKNSMTHPIVTIKLSDGLGFFNHNDLSWTEAFKLSTNSLGEVDEDLKTEKDFENDGQVKDYFNREFDFSKDAALIARLVAQDQSVALISSFETKILMQADRRPFFYYTPFVDSRPMHRRMFSMTTLWTTGRLSKTLKQLQENKPSYIFMEKILMAQSVPSSYQYLYPEMLVLLNYIHQYYVPEEEGHYLIAMKRKESF